MTDSARAGRLEGATGLDGEQAMSRRAVLASAGVGVVGALAGCIAGDHDTTERYEPAEYAGITERALPTVERPVPVEPAAEAIDASLARAEELLEPIPSPLTVEDVPNGVVRTEITDRRAGATETRDALKGRSNPFETLWDARGAREEARIAGTTYLAVEGEATRDALETERTEIRESIASAAAEIDYVGEAVDRTLLLGYRLEAAVERAEGVLDRTLRRRNATVVDLGEAAGELERVRATADATGHFLERHRARLGAERSFEVRAETALERALDDLGTVDLPDDGEMPESIAKDVDAASPAGFLFSSAEVDREGTLETLRDHRENGRFALGLEAALAAVVREAAARTIRERIVAGEYRSVEGPEAVRATRKAAIEAVADAVATPEQSLLTDLLARERRRLAYADGSIEGAREDERATTLASEYADYLEVRHRLEAAQAARSAYERWTEVP